MMRVFKDYSPRMREPAVAVQILAATMLLSIISFGIYMSSPNLIARPLLWTFWFAGFMIAAWWCPHIAGRNLLIGFGPDLMLLSATLILPERGLLWLLIMCALTFHYFIWSKSVRRALLGISSTMVAALPGWIISESIGGITAFDGQRNQHALSSLSLLLLLCLTFTAVRLCLATLITMYTERTFPGTLRHLNWTQVLVMPLIYCVVPTILVTMRSLPRIVADAQWNEAFNVLTVLVMSSGTFRIIEGLVSGLSKRNRLLQLEKATDSLSLSTQRILSSATVLLSSIYPRMRVSLAVKPPRTGPYSSTLLSGTITSTDGPLRIIVVRTVWNKPFDEVDRLAVNLIASMLRIIYRVRLETSRLTVAANTDPLTGVSNFRGFETALAQQDILGNPDGAAAIFIDVDQFKSINDSYGHQAGNEVLQALARRLTEAVGQDKLIARLGGDEFAIVISGVHTHKEAKPYIKRVEESVNRPVMTGAGPIPLHISHGLSFTRSGKDYQSLLDEADVRMYASRRKQASSQKVSPPVSPIDFSALMPPAPLLQPSVFGLEDDFPPEPRPSHQHSQDRDDAVALAIQRDAIEIYYQPIINLNTRRLLALEALVRYHDPEFGDIPVADILRVASEHDLTGAISESMLMHAVADTAIFHEIEPELVLVNVNVTMSDLLNPQFRAHLQQTVESNPDLHIIIEITEDSLSTTTEAELKSVEQFVKKRHIDLALDDAGTLYSELAVLVRLPVRVVKIDKSIVDRLPSARVSALMMGFVSTCDKLNIEVVFEGIETPEQEKAIREFGGRLVQGFLYGRPINAMETDIRLQTSGLSMQADQEWPLSPSSAQNGTSGHRDVAGSKAMPPSEDFTTR
ncbi:MAG: bifunctional diguanylate cyclase/phosphodiesterase [Bifidobacterium psychraerophilum]|uniref:EAL domain-containing protein n=1 Tax=Bifidobacterium psychraerophilum TaxID=218140 RepID=UPI0039EC98A4